MERAATPIAYVASGATVLLGLTVEEWGVVGIIVGIVLGLATFSVNWYYQHKRTNRRE